MAEPIAATGHGVFLSYRRGDTPHLAGRLYDRLVGRFGHARVFMDVDSIEPGADFADAIDGAVKECGVLLVLIGQNWIDAHDEDGLRRLTNPDDFVVLEIRAALERNVRVLPVLVDGARPPRGSQLPQALLPLARRHAIRVDHETFRSDVDTLLDAIAKTLDPQRPSVRTTGTTAAPTRNGPSKATRIKTEIDVTAVRSRARLFFDVEGVRHGDDDGHVVGLSGTVTEKGTTRSLPVTGRMVQQQNADTKKLDLTLSFGHGRIVAQRDFGLDPPGLVPGKWLWRLAGVGGRVSLRGHLSGGDLEPEDVEVSVPTGFLVSAFGS